MTKKLFDKDGNEVEAIPKEELDEKVEEAKEEVREKYSEKEEELGKTKKELENKKEDIKELETKIEDIQEEIDEGGNTDEQKKRLKNQKEEAEKKLENVKSELGGKIKELRSEIYKKEKDEAIKNLSNGDPEIEERIEKEMEMFSEEATKDMSQSEIVEKAARIVHADQPIPNFTDNLGSSSSRGDIQKHQKKEKESEASKAQRKHLGISDKDVEKYGNKDE